MFYQDSILRFLSASSDWAETVVIDKPNTFALNSLPGDPKDCFLFQRHCNVDEMETEDDERYVFSTPDYAIRVILNRFQTRIILKQFNPIAFNPDRIEFIIKMAWNYPRLAVNKKTAEFEPYNDGQGTLMPPIPVSGGPPIRQIYIED
jgi:hypothetical protein